MPLDLKYECFRETPIQARTSAPGVSPLLLLRLSGRDCFPLLMELFPEHTAFLSECPGYAVLETHLDLLGASWPLEVLLYRAPRSYTGEDQAEFALPGHPALLSALQDRLSALGVRTAERGEFSRRAVLHGRLDLSEAVGVFDAIRAESDDELRQAAVLLDGDFRRALDHCQIEMLSLVADAEAFLDLDDQESDSEQLLQSMRQRVVAVRERLQAMDRRSGPLQSAPEMPTVALEGAVNAGKSTLFNRLAGASLAMESTIPGSTRDVLGATIRVQGTSFRLLDTPGHHVTTAALDREAMRLAQEATASADVRLWLLDAEHPVLPPLDHPVPDLWLLNKMDRVSPSASLPEGCPEAETLSISALTGEGIERLLEWLACFFASRTRLVQGVFARRQAEAFENSLAELGLGEERYLRGEPELAATHLRLAADAFFALRGDLDAPRLLDEIFQRFCVGK